MRGPLTREGLHDLMREIARRAPGGRSFRVFLVGGGTAVQAGWRASTIDADLYSDQEEVFRDIQGIKERLQLNVEFARPEDFVPALAGSEGRHILIERIDNVSFYHYDPYAQLLSKVVRGFEKDVQDAESFLASGMVDAERFRFLVREIPEAAYARYPALSQRAVIGAVDEFLAEIERTPLAQQREREEGRE
ncbi:MAG TPA: DUF6036 family nucleotidyltransferase [Acidobacteriota bacterium]